MKMTSEQATLAVAEDDIGDDSDEDDDGENNEDEDGRNSDTCTFDVPHFRYIDDDNVEEEEKEREWRDGGRCTPWSRPSEEDCCNSSSCRYVVVSGTPLKILEHLLSDLRLDDQRGAPESRESGTVEGAHTNTPVFVGNVHTDTSVRGRVYTKCAVVYIKRHNIDMKLSVKQE